MVCHIYGFGHIHPKYFGGSTSSAAASKSSRLIIRLRRRLINFLAFAISAAASPAVFNEGSNLSTGPILCL